MIERKPKVLIIDDEVDWAHSTKMLLQDKYKIDFVETGNEGVQKLKTTDYDVIVIDWQLMEEKTGTDVMVEIKGFNKIIPVIIVSGKIEERKPVIEAIQKGATNYVEKLDPDLSSKLDKTIQEAFENRDRVVVALERWIDEIEDPDRVLIRTVSGEEYTAKQILAEVKKDSEIGRIIREGIVKIIVDLIEKGEISV
jgi:DNA-binding NtrC family response regulator